MLIKQISKVHQEHAAPLMKKLPEVQMFSWMVTSLYSTMSLYIGYEIPNKYMYSQ